MNRFHGSTPSARDAWLRGSAWWAWLGALLLLTSAVALVGNGESRGLDRSETFVARVPTEMARRAQAGQPHAWLVPYFNGEVRLQKPPMNYWLAMGAHALLARPGSDIVGAFEARLPSALAAVATALVCVWMGCIAFSDRRVGLLAGALLATTVGSLTESHHARPEMVYAFFTAAMAACFTRGLRAAQNGEPARAWSIAAWACFAAASLTKGPHIPALVVAGCIVALVIRDRRQALKVVRPISGLALACVVAGAWFYMIHRAEPEALRFWFGEVFNRTGWVDPDAASESVRAPWWSHALSFYYVRGVVQVTAPWCLLLVGAAMLPWRRRDETGSRAMLLWWSAVIPLAALSFSAFMRTQYIAPVLPMLVVLMAGEAIALIDRWGADDPRPGLLRALHLVHAGAAIALCGVVVYVVAGARPGTTGGPESAVVSCVIAGLGAATALAGAARAKAAPRFGVASLPLAVALAWIGGSASGVWWSGARAARADFAREVGRVAPRSAPLVAMGGETAVIVYYADRTVREVRDRAELERVLDDHPDALLMTRPRIAEREGVAGNVVAQERGVDANAPMVLLSNVRLTPAR